jgi:hypothetical protein
MSAPPPSVADVEKLVRLHDAAASFREHAKASYGIRVKATAALVAALRAHVHDAGACVRLLSLPEWTRWPLGNVTAKELWGAVAAALAKHRAHVRFVRCLMSDDVWVTVYRLSPTDRELMPVVRDLLGFVLDAEDAALADAEFRNALGYTFHGVWCARPRLRELMLRMGVARAARRLDGFWVNVMRLYEDPSPLREMLVRQLNP